MTTECSGKHLEFHPLGQREATSGFQRRDNESLAFRITDD